MFHSYRRSIMFSVIKAILSYLNFNFIVPPADAPIYDHLYSRRIVWVKGNQYLLISESCQARFRQFITEILKILLQDYPLGPREAWIAPTDSLTNNFIPILSEKHHASSVDGMISLAGLYSTNKQKGFLKDFLRRFRNSFSCPFDTHQYGTQLLY